MDTDGPSAAYAATTDESRKRTQRGVAATKVARTSKSAVSRVSKPAAGATAARPADWEVGDTAGLETCATRRCALPPHSKILAAHDDSDVLQCKEPGDTTSFLCVPYVLSRPILCQENKDLHNCSTEGKAGSTMFDTNCANYRQRNARQFAKLASAKPGFASRPYRGLAAYSGVAATRLYAGSIRG